MSCPLFTLCPEEGVFQVRILQNSSSGMVLLYKTAKKTKSNHVRVISPLQSQPTYRRPDFSSKGSRRALSQKEKKKQLVFHTLYFISAEVSVCDPLLQ